MGWDIWETHYNLNRDYLGEEWQATADWVNTGGDSEVWEAWPGDFSRLVTGLQESERDSEEWKIYMGIQAATLTIRDLQKYLLSQEMDMEYWGADQLESLPKFIGWAWHILHMEP